MNRLASFLDVQVGDHYWDSSGDYRVTYVALYVAWASIRVTPDDYRGTPGRRELELTVHDDSIALGKISHP